MSRWSLCALLAVAVLLTAGVLCSGQPGVNTAASDPFADEPAAKPAKTAPKKPRPKKAAPVAEIRTGEAAIERALDEPTSLEFDETPLQYVIGFLEDRHHIEIQLDKPAMDDVGIDVDIPVTKNLKGVSLRSALRLMLRDLRLTCLIQDGVLLITTPEYAEASLTTRVYDVADLVVFNDDRRGLSEDYETLKDVICSHVDPTAWQCCGPPPIPGESIGTAKVLVISQTYEVHRDIADLLNQIRDVAAKHGAVGGMFAVPAESPADVAPAKSPPKKAAPAKELRSGEAAIERALDSPTRIEFVDTPLQDVVDYLKDYHQIEIQLDKVAMADVGIGTDTPVTKTLKGISLRSALRLMLRELKLTYTIQDEALLITTPETAAAHLITRVYDVADLVVYNDDMFGRWDDYDSLRDAITCTTGPTTWDTNGGPGDVSGASFGTAKVLIVSQTYQVHREIADLLKQIRAVAAKHSGDGLPRRDCPRKRPPSQMGGMGGMGGMGAGPQQPATGNAPQQQGMGGGMFAVPAEKPADVAPEKPQPRKLPAKKPQPKRAAPAKPLGTGEAAIERALDSPTQLEFVKMPLDQVVEYLKDYHHIEIRLDKIALEDVGVPVDRPVTENLKGISLRSALRLMLRELKLDYLVKNDVLLVTTPETEEASLTTRVYDVSDLVVCIDDKVGRWDDYDSLIETIVRTVEPTTWETDREPQTGNAYSQSLGCMAVSCVGGGPGTIAGRSLGTAKVLVVSQTYEVHREIADLLKEIRAVAAKHSGDGLPRRDRPKPQPCRGLGEQKSATGKAAQGERPGVEEPVVPGK